MASIGTQRRFREAMEEYRRGVLYQIEYTLNGEHPPLDELFHIRRGSIACAPVFPLLE
jgi:hypothetical protein